MKWIWLILSPLFFVFKVSASPQPEIERPTLLDDSAIHRIVQETLETIKPNNSDTPDDSGSHSPDSKKALRDEEVKRSE